MSSKPTQKAKAPAQKAPWTVKESSKARKGEKELPKKLKIVVKAVKRSLAMTGQAYGMDHYSRLEQRGKGYFHCHLGTHRGTTYVAYWRVNKKSKIIDFEYCGTHEGARY